MRKRSKAKGEVILELSESRREEINKYWEGRDIPKDLISQCAYFPKACQTGHDSQCVECTFEVPNKKCKYSHILRDSRIERRKGK